MSFIVVRLQRLLKTDKSITTILQFAVSREYYDVQSEIIRTMWQHHIVYPHPLCKYWIEDATMPATLPENEDNLIRGEN